MTQYTHDWITDLDGILCSEAEHCRDGMRQYAEGPDHDLYAAHLANVTELRQRLRLYDAADNLLIALRAVTNELIELYEQKYTDDESDNDTTIAIDAGLAAIANAEGRTE